MNMSYESAKRRLGVVWLILGGALFFLLFSQSIFDKYGDDDSAVWQWFLPTIVPTFALIMAVFGVDALETIPPEKKRVIDAFYYWLALGISVAYLLVVAGTLIGASVVPEVPNIAILRRSQVWLAFVQGLATAAVGIFFIKKDVTPAPG